jgi:hypothetical protein
MTPDQIEVIERLRDAATTHGEVANLLPVLCRSILIDGAGNREIIAEADDLECLQAAFLAGAFSEYDRSKDRPVA